MSRAVLYATPKLAALRQARGWTQKEFAVLLTMESGQNVSQSLVEKWERKARTINAEMALEIAKIFKLNDPREIVEQENL